MPKDFVQVDRSGHDDRIVKWAPWGTGIALKCPECGAHFSTKNIGYIGARSIFPGYGMSAKETAAAYKCDQLGHKNLVPDPEHFDAVHKARPGYALEGYDGNGDVEALIRAQERKAEEARLVKVEDLRKRLEAAIPIGAKMVHHYKEGNSETVHEMIVVITGFKPCGDPYWLLDVCYDILSIDGEKPFRNKDDTPGQWMLDGMGYGHWKIVTDESK
jgi:hypothetical protein